MINRFTDRPQIIRTHGNLLDLPFQTRSRTYDHFLKRKDADQIRGLVYHLHSLIMRSYLGGSAVNNFIWTGKKEYADLDILAVAENEENRLDLVNALENSSKKDKDYIFFDSMGDKFSYKVNSFDENQMLYLGVMVDKRFKLTPELGKVRGLLAKLTPLDLTPSKIDLNIISKERFDYLMNK